MDPETNFFNGLIELQYGQNVEKELERISKKVPWAKGWPKEIKSFWNAEAFMWKYKISKERRGMICRELNFLKGKNLDLGCGAYSYIPSVGFDISEKMLLFNDNCTEKFEGNLEESLPFENEGFDSVTAIFVLNYVKNYGRLLSEIGRIVLDGGMFVMVLCPKINDWQSQKEINRFSSVMWKGCLQQAGFSVGFYEKEGLWFFKCRKSN